MSIPFLPVTIVTGFLGAGKTTLLNRILTDPAFADSMVLVNEFGAIGLDHLLMQQAGEGVVLLASGCLCCALRGDLVDTLADLAQRRATGALPPFSRVIIETSGLADPAPVMQSVMAPQLAGAGYVLAGVVTLVDAVNGDATLDHEAVSRSQVAVADHIVLSKTDLSADTGQLEERLNALNPHALRHDAASVTPDLLFARSVRETAAVPAGDMQLSRGLARRGGFACEDASISSMVLTTAQAMSAATLEAFLALLVERHGDGLLRLKALVALDDAPQRPLVVQGVRHQIYPTARLAAWPEGELVSRFVLIGRDLDADAVLALFESFTGALRPDAPDRAALTDNPLSLGRR